MFAQVESALFQLVLETMTNALRMTSMHGIYSGFFWDDFFWAFDCFSVIYATFLNSVVFLGKKLSGQSWIDYFGMKMMPLQALHTQLLFLNTGLNSSNLRRQLIWRETSALQMDMQFMMPSILASKNATIPYICNNGRSWRPQVLL